MNGTLTINQQELDLLLRSYIEDVVREQSKYDCGVKDVAIRVHGATQKMDTRDEEWQELQVTITYDAQLLY